MTYSCITGLRWPVANWDVINVNDHKNIWGTNLSKNKYVLGVPFGFSLLNLALWFLNFKIWNVVTFLVWFKIIILRYLQKTLIYRSYQGTWKYLAMSYVGFLFLKNSFTPSWQVARIWAVKPYHSNGLMRLNQLLTLKLVRCLLTIVPVLLGVVFFSMGVIKFNTPSKWYNSYFLGYDGNLIKVISRCFKVKCFSRQIFLRVVFPS